MFFSVFTGRLLCKRPVFIEVYVYEESKVLTWEGGVKCRRAILKNPEQQLSGEPP